MVMLVLQAVCALLAIAIVHSDNRLTSTIAMGPLQFGVAASVLLILAHDRPFSGIFRSGLTRYCRSCRRWNPVSKEPSPDPVARTSPRPRATRGQLRLPRY